MNSLLSKMPYDSLRDFTPIIQVNAFPQVLIVNPVVPAKTAKELIAIARARPGVLTFGRPAWAAPSIWPGSSSIAWPRSICFTFRTKAATWR